MSVKCNIKASIEAWNHGVDSFQDAMLTTGGDMSKSLKYAISKVQEKYPDLDFEVESFTSPLIEAMKKEGIIPENYKFGKTKSGTKEIDAAKKEQEKLAKQQEKEEFKHKKKVEDVVSKFEGLNDNQKKEVARDIIDSVIENGMINDADVANSIAKATGKPFYTKEFDAAIKKSVQANVKLEETSTAIDEKVDEIQSLKDKGEYTDKESDRIEKELSDLEKEYDKARNSANEALQNLSNQMEPYHFWFFDMMNAAQLNLMGVRSLLKNITGTVPDAAIRNMGDLVGSIFGAGFKLFKAQNPLPFGQKTLGAIEALKSGKVSSNMKSAAKYGTTTFENEIPHYNFLSAANKLRQLKESTGGKEKMKNLAAFLLRIHPDAISKGLASPDQAIYTFVYEGELNSIAESKGLKGAEKKAFLMKPDEKSVEYAKKRADLATFKQNTIISENVSKTLSFNAYEYYKKRSKEVSPSRAKIEGSLFLTAKVLFAPFVKTPINIVHAASKYIFPEVYLAKTLISDIKKEEDPNFRNKIIAEEVGRFVVGAYLRNVAINMVMGGLITASYGDEERKSLDTQKQVKGGYAKINLSALMRGMTFQGYEEKKGDMWVDLSALGFTGLIFGTYAHAYSKMSEEEKKEIPQNPLDYEFYLNSSKMILPTVKNSLETSFLAGTNMAYKAFVEEKEDQIDKFKINFVNLLLSGTFNSTFQNLSSATNPYELQVFDKKKSFSENLLNNFGYKFMFGTGTDDVKEKYFNLSEKGKGKVKRNYMLFDNYFGRALASNLDALKLTKDASGSELGKLLTAASKVGVDARKDYFPNGIGTTQKIGDEKIELTTEQHEYLLEKASQYQLAFAAPVINSESFDSSASADQTKALKEAYKAGLEQAKLMLQEKYPDITSQKTDKNLEQDEIEPTEESNLVNLIPTSVEK